MARAAALEAIAPCTICQCLVNSSGDGMSSGVQLEDRLATLGTAGQWPPSALVHASFVLLGKPHCPAKQYIEGAKVMLWK